MKPSEFDSEVRLRAMGIMFVVVDLSGTPSPH